MFFASSLVLNILIARYYQASLSGWIYYIINFYTFILLLLSLSLESGIGYFVSKKDISASRLLNFSMLWTVVAGAFVFVLFYWRRGDTSAGISHPLYLFSALCYVCGNLLITYCSNLFYAEKNFWLPNCLLVGINIILILLVIPFGIWFPFLLEGERYLFIYFFGFLLQGLLLPIVFKLRYLPTWEGKLPSVEEFKKLLRYCLAAFTGNVIFFLLYRIDYIFVKKYCTAQDLGNYIQVSKLGQMFILLPIIFASAIFPLTAGGQREEVNHVLKIMTRILLVLLGSCCLVLALTGNWLFPFVFGESFSRMYKPFLLLIPGILALSSLNPLAAYYAGKNRLGVNVKGSVFALMVIIAGDIIFIPRFGTQAAAAVSSLGYMVYYFYVLRIFTHEYQASIGEFYLIRSSDFRWLKTLILESIEKK
jgi:O-antigen/teichoic acid export membrane protein